MSRKLVSVVLPVFNTADSLLPLYAELNELFLSPALDLDHELILVEDCGTDNAWTVLTELARTDSRVRVFRHKINYGQHAAIATGLAQARGDICVVMDADGKDPPRVIVNLLEQYFQGFDMVVAVRTRISGSLFRRVCSFLVRRSLRLYRRLPNGKSYGSFFLISKRAASYYLADRDRFRFSLRVLERIPFDIGLVQYEQNLTGSSKSTYSFLKLVSLLARFYSDSQLKQARRIACSGAFFGAVSVIAWSLVFPKAVFLLLSLAFTGLIAIFSLCLLMIGKLRSKSSEIEFAEVIEKVDSRELLAVN